MQESEHGRAFGNRIDLAHHENNALDNTQSVSVQRAAIVLGAILLAGVSFKLTFAPLLSAGPYVLKMSPVIHQNVAAALARDWTALLLPFPYEFERNFWSPTAIFITYFIENTLGAYGSYIFWSSLFVVTSFVCALACFPSLTFAATLAFMFAFGTQLDYAYTYGNLIALYLVLSYIAVNFTLAYLFATGRFTGAVGLAAFTVSLTVTALSNEMWINYATALMTGTLFATVWAHHHRLAAMRTRSLALFCATVLVLGAYLAVRLRLAPEYLHPGSEEELVVTYHSKLLLIDDVIANFMTLLYMVVDNYFPSFVSSSNSLIYLGDGSILAEQHGYDQVHQDLVLLNHLFMWRFYAGLMAACFGAFAVFVFVRAWRTASERAAIMAALCLMIFAGFSTHLSIKMRPYNAVPALPYKAIVSISVFTVLIAFLVAVCADRFRSRRVYLGAVVAVWGCVFLAALTRPVMQDRLLAEVGLVGFGDPLGQIIQWLR